MNKQIKSSENKIRVLHFTIANTGGGITKFVLRLWKYIDRERYQFDFVTMSTYLDFAEELEAEGCKIFYLSTYAEDDRDKFIKEVTEILDNGYDIVHLHTSWWRGFLLEDIAREKKVPKIIVHSHNTDVHIKENQSRQDARKLHFEQRELLTENKATDFIACSEEAAEWLYGDKISKNKVHIIPYAIEIDNYTFNSDLRESYRTKLGLKSDDYVIVHVGRFAYQKNHDFLLEVFKSISEEHENTILLLVGIGELEEQIRSRVYQYKLDNKVLFLGKRDDVNCIMQAADIFAFPSRFEGFGIVLIEAQAAGLKCIVSNEIPAIAKITKNIEFLPLDQERWKENLQKYRNGYRREDMSEIMENSGFGMSTLVRKIEDIYFEGVLE